jgi:hypothetical protein
MTRRATFTQAELERAIRAADKRGKVAAVTTQGLIVFVESKEIALPSQDTEPAARGNSCDEAFGP